jgi:hypothetical protein
MNANLLAFELVLLSRMENAYQEQLLKNANLSQLETEKIRASCKIQYFDLFKCRTNDYKDALSGVVIESTQANVPEEGFWENHAFELILWPHMEWEYFSLNGLVWSGHFRNKYAEAPSASELPHLQIGRWCQYQLEPLASKIRFVDGWSEQMKYEIDFDSGRYEGYFVFDLLQSWRKLT